MKASELIAQVSALMLKHGDLDVCRDDYTHGEVEAERVYLSKDVIYGTESSIVIQ